MSDQIHIGGLASGMDTQATIDKLVALKGKPLIKMQEEKDAITADVTAWTDVLSRMSSLTTALDTLRKWETWNQMTSTSSDVTKLTATASSSAIETIYNITISQLAQAHTIGSAKADDLAPGATSATDLVAAGVLTAGNQFIIEGQTITIGATESLSSLRTKINTAASSMPANNRVFASILDNRLVLTRASTGSTQISLSNSTGSPLQNLGILDGGGGYQNELLAAQNAEFMVNGAAVSRSSNTNLTDVIENVTLNLKNTTALGENLTLSITKDTDTAKNAILAFIEAYNDVASTLTEYGKVTVNSSSSKNNASPDDVGELQGDSMVKAILNNMRKQATAQEYPYLNENNAGYSYKGRDGICDTLSAIGIWTAGKDNSISITDETRLDDMLAGNFDKVAQLFRGVYDAQAGYTHGIASDFYKYSNQVTSAIDGDIERRISALNDKFNDVDKNMTKLEDSLDVYERRLWIQFGKMEEAIAKMNSELSYLSGQLKSS